MCQCGEIVLVHSLFTSQVSTTVSTLPRSLTVVSRSRSIYLYGHVLTVGSPVQAPSATLRRLTQSRLAPRVTSCTFARIGSPAQPHGALPSRPITSRLLACAVGGTCIASFIARVLLCPRGRPAQACSGALCCPTPGSLTNRAMSQTLLTAVRVSPRSCRCHWVRVSCSCRGIRI